MSVNVDQIVVSGKFKHNNEGFKYFIGYQEGEIVKLLYIILPQMSGYIKYFENGGKNMYFLINDDEVWEKYEQIWDVIKNKLDIKFHSKPIYERKYLKTKVMEFDGVIKTNVLGNDMPTENIHYTCIAYITYMTVMRIDKKNHPHVYLEECKYRVKKVQMSRFINTEAESKSEAELMAKLKSDSNSE